MTTWAEAFSNAAPIIATAIATPLAALLGAVLWKLAAWAGYKATEKQKAILEADIGTALKFGISQALPTIAREGWNSPTARTEALAFAVSFLKERFPDQANKIEVAGVTSDDPIHDSLGARLPEAMTAAAQSPATPPIDLATLHTISK